MKLIFIFIFISYLSSQPGLSTLFIDIRLDLVAGIVCTCLIALLSEKNKTTKNSPPLSHAGGEESEEEESKEEEKKEEEVRKAQEHRYSMHQDKFTPTHHD